MKTDEKKKIIAKYLSEKNKAGGLALKAKMPKDYYKIIGAKGKKSRWSKLKPKTVDNSNLEAS